MEDMLFQNTHGEATMNSDGPPTNNHDDNHNEQSPDDSPQNLLFQASLAAIAALVQEYTCPLSLELMVDPVTAQDGHLYEREDIEQTIRVQGKRNLRSPRTNEKMGSKLLPAVAARNTTRILVESGAVEGDTVVQYRQRKLVIETKAKANNGGIESMWNLMNWHKDGENGLDENEERFEYWRKKIIGTTTASAKGGHVEAMLSLAAWYKEGENGLPKDLLMSTYWYDKAEYAEQFQNNRGRPIAKDDA